MHPLRKQSAYYISTIQCNYKYVILNKNNVETLEIEFKTSFIIIIKNQQM